MSIQTKSYIEEMKEMYGKITLKERLNEIDLLFLDLFNKTIGDFI